MVSFNPRKLPSNLSALTPWRVSRGYTVVLAKNKLITLCGYQPTKELQLVKKSCSKLQNLEHYSNPSLKISEI